MALMQLNIFSKTLNMPMDVWAIIPDTIDHEQDKQKIKTFWFMHGGSAGHTSWIRSTNIEKEARDRNIAVIMPTAHDSSCVNMFQWHRYNDYLGGELPTIMRNIFPILSHDRNDNWLGGFSNGGYGCLNIGLKYPQTFGRIFAGGAGDKAEVDWSTRMHEKKRVYGAETDMLNSEYSIHYLAKNLINSLNPASSLMNNPAETLGGANPPCPPKIFHICGENDPWLHMNHSVRDLFQSFDNNPFAYEYMEIKNEGHTAAAMEIGYTAFFNKVFAT